MRINGFTQMKSFYSWVFENQDKNIRSTHVSLYMFLLNQNNRNSWVEWFKCPFDLAMGGSGISNKKTYYKTLNDLQDWNLIEYKKGVNNYKAPMIKLEVLFDTSTVPQSEPQLQPQVIPLPTPLLQPQLYKNVKLITNNIELVTLNIKRVLNFLKTEDEEQEDADKPPKEKKRKKVPAKKEKIDYQEVVEFFNNTCTLLPKVQKLTKKRESAIRKRIEEYSAIEVGEVLIAVSKSSFLNGKSSLGWKANFDWIMKPNNFIKVLEGQYKDKEAHDKQNAKFEAQKEAYLANSNPNDLM